MEKDDSALKTVFKIEIDVAEEPPKAWHTSDSHLYAPETPSRDASSADPDVLNAVKVKVEPEEVPESTPENHPDDADVEDKDLPVFFMAAPQSSGADAPSSSVSIAEKEEGTGKECTTTSFPAPQLDSTDEPSSSVGISETDDMTGNQSTAEDEGPTPPLSTLARQGTSPRAKMAQYFYVAYPTPQSRIAHEAKKSVSSSPQIKYSCNDCDASFTSPAELSNHMQTHAKKGPFTCCDTSFSYDGILAHLKTHTVEKTYPCKQCKATFSSAESYAVHMRRHTGEKPFVCKECGSAFGAYSTLKAHARKHHSKKSYSCSECNATFPDAKGLSAHATTHPEKKTFSCQTCGASFSVLKSLNGHMRMHTGDKSFTCEECSATFKSSECLTEHKKKHTGAKPFACGECDATFSNSEGLTTHKGTHFKQNK